LYTQSIEIGSLQDTITVAEDATSGTLIVYNGYESDPNGITWSQHETCSFSFLTVTVEPSEGYTNLVAVIDV
jgi:hypothetical protein